MGGLRFQTIALACEGHPLFRVWLRNVASFGGHEEVGGINLVGIELGDGNAAHRVHFLNTVYLVSPKGDAQQVVGVSR